MRKVVLLIVLGIIFISEIEAKKIEGQILFKDDTVDVIFKIPIDLLTQEIIYEKLQYKVKYFDFNGKKIKLIPDNAEEIRFKYNNEDIRMLSRYNSLDIGDIFSMRTNIFLKLKVEGKLMLFEYHYTQKTGSMSKGIPNDMTMPVGMSYPVERYNILQKGDGELKRPKGLSFRKDMMNYFSDCPELSQKIENKEYKKRDLESIVRFYNSNCGK